MADPDTSWLTPLPAELRPPLLRAARGLAPNVALMQLLMQCAAPAQAENALNQAIAGLHSLGDQSGAARMEVVRALATANPDAFRVVRWIIDGLDHANQSGPHRLSYWAEAFDRAARHEPNASVDH